MRVFFLTTIDTECDKGLAWKVRYPFSFTNITEGVLGKLHPLLEKYGVRATYLLSSEVISDEKSTEALRSMANQCEVGTHLHGEYVEPFPNYAAVKTDDYQADYTYEIEREKIRNLTNHFCHVFGYRPASFRAGRFGAGRNTFKILNELGYQVDSSIYPFRRLITKRYHLNYYYFPVEPFYPDPENLFEPATTDKGILHIPITVSSIFFQSLPAVIGKAFSSHRTMGVLSKLFGKNLINTFSLRPSSNSIEKMKEICEYHLMRHKNSQAVFLTMMFHSNELMPETSPYCRTDEDVEVLLKKLDAVFRYVSELRASFVTMSEAKQVVDTISTDIPRV